MMRVVIAKELTEYCRDARVVGVAALLCAIVGLGLATGWATHAEQARQARRAQLDDAAAFLGQGSKSPHAAAHFGRMAYRTLPPLAAFDPGAAPYLGQVIWLEAHRRDPAMFRPAEDSPALRRLAEPSAASALALLVPLLAFLLGGGAFAGERERGTLRLVLSVGPRVDSVFAGKLAAVAGAGAIVSAVVICASTGVALTAPGGVSAGETLVRAGALVASYGAYALASAAVALFVSARSRDAASALAALLCVWAVTAVILPRVAASVAERVHPAPEATAFWADAARAVRAAQPERGSAAWRALEAEAASRALGRAVTPAELDAGALSRQGLVLEVGETLGAAAYAEAYDGLFATYRKQQRVRRWASLLAPAIALQHVSSALAGTDVAAHEHFADAAERRRLLVVRRLNEDMMLRGAGQGFDYVAGADAWTSVPDFDYAPPDARSAVRSVLWELIVLAAWAIVAPLAAWRAARAQRV
jgi:ABC-2 type transport system permease protein